MVVDLKLGIFHAASELHIPTAPTGGIYRRKLPARLGMKIPLRRQGKWNQPLRRPFHPPGIRFHRRRKLFHRRLIRFHRRLIRFHRRRKLFHRRLIRFHRHRKPFHRRLIRFHRHRKAFHMGENASLPYQKPFPTPSSDKQDDVGMERRLMWRIHRQHLHGNPYPTPAIASSGLRTPVPFTPFATWV
jgi:hypothetical protein